MTEIVAQARALRDSVAATDVVDLFLTGNEGARVVALGLVEAEPTADFFELVLDGISASRSAFEQFHALTAAIMLPALSRQQREALADALEAERADVRGLQPQADASRWQLMNELQRQLVPPQSATRTEAIKFERRVREAIEMASGVVEIAEPLGTDARESMTSFVLETAVWLSRPSTQSAELSRGECARPCSRWSGRSRDSRRTSGLIVLPQPIQLRQEELDQRIRSRRQRNSRRS